METLAGIIGFTGLVLLLFFVVTPFELVFRECMLERFSVKMYGIVRRVLFCVSVVNALEKKRPEWVFLCWLITNGVQKHETAHNANDTDSGPSFAYFMAFVEYGFV